MSTIQERIDELSRFVSRDCARSYEEAIARLDAAADDYERKFDVPVIGLFYSMPAWRRYQAAHREFTTRSDLFLAELKKRIGP